MFISESYIRLQQDSVANFEEDETFVDISLDLKSGSVWSLPEDGAPLRRSKRLFKSENDIGKLKSNVCKSKSITNVLNMSSRSSSPGYEGDTDTDPGESPPTSISPLNICDICGLEFLNDILVGYNLEEEKTVKTYKKKRRSKKGLDTSLYTPPSGVDFDDYKDYNHKMEVFDPSSERKWTLQYQYKKDTDRPSLAKIIIGRGQNDQYADMNNIHLIQDGRGYEKCNWRKTWLDCLKAENKKKTETFSRFPNTSTCLFCFRERNDDILKSTNSQSQTPPRDNAGLNEDLIPAGAANENGIYDSTPNGDDTYSSTEDNSAAPTDAQTLENLPIDSRIYRHDSPIREIKNDSTVSSQDIKKMKNGHLNGLTGIDDGFRNCGLNDKLKTLHPNVFHSKKSNNDIDVSTINSNGDLSRIDPHNDTGLENSEDSPTYRNKENSSHKKSRRQFSSKMRNLFTIKKTSVKNDNSVDDDDDFYDDEFVIIL